MLGGDMSHKKQKMCALNVLIAKKMVLMYKD